MSIFCDFFSFFRKENSIDSTEETYGCVFFFKSNLFPSLFLLTFRSLVFVQGSIFRFRGRRPVARAKETRMAVAVFSLRQRDGRHAYAVRGTDWRGLAPNPAEFYGGHVRGQGPHTEFSYRDVHFLHRLLHRISILLRQHLRGLDYHHFPGAGRGRVARRRNRQKSGWSKVFITGHFASKIFFQSKKRVVITSRC